MVKTKYRLQGKVWLPGMDKDVGHLCKVCYGCQVLVVTHLIRCLTFCLQVLLTKLQCRFGRTPTHRKEYFVGG